MAGAGYKAFADGDVLTAAQVQTYLQDQAVMRFADSSARTSGLGTAVAEGMVSYLQDTDLVEVYDGSAWTAVSQPGVVAVKYAEFTGTQTNSTAAGASFDITDLSITHEVADAANRLIITGFVGALGSTAGRVNAGIAAYDGTNLLSIGDASGSATRTTTGGQQQGSTDSGNVSNNSFTIIHTPGTGSKTYTLRAVNITTGTQTIYVNRRQTEASNASDPRTASGLLIQEVAV